MEGESMYETKISDVRWYAYDVPGNLGWIAYITVLILLFIKKPDFLSRNSMLVIMILAVFPAVMMLIGICELISERVHKLDRILSKARLYRGFGMLTLGGCAGALISGIGLICGYIEELDCVTYLWIMLAGGILCAVFAGLLFKGYKRA